MRLAADLGLSAAPVELRRIGTRLVLLVRRFDRLLDATGTLRREHHETFAQALAVPPERKYEVRGGPGVGALAEPLRRHGSNAARDLHRLSTLVVYNALIGNADAHVGNFGLMHYANGATRLAPAYDLLPHQAVLGSPPKGYAMRLGGTYEFGNLTRDRMLELGGELRVAPRGVVAIWERLREEIPVRAKDVAESLTRDHELTADEATLLDRIVADVTSRC